MLTESQISSCYFHCKICWKREKKALVKFYGQSKNKETDVNNFIVNPTENKGKNSVCKDSEPGYLRGKT